jgi:hypothetical protein
MDRMTQPTASETGSSMARCSLLQLPAELLILVIDSLDPSSRILAGFTCKTLHAALFSSTVEDLRKLPTCQYDQHVLAILEGLALHNRYVCVCHRLHCVDAHDLPGIRKDVRFNGCWPASAKIGNFSKYCLHQRHVQLALRYSRTKIYQAELMKLLRPFHVSGNSVYNPMSWEFRAQPVIADGNYIMYTREAFHPLYNSEITMGQCQFLEICPHIVTAPRWAGDTSHLQLRLKLEQIMDKRGTRTSGWCYDCATDFSLMSTKAGLEVEVWYDFGSDASPSSRHWTSHVTYLHGESADEIMLQRISLGPPAARKLKEKYERAMLPTIVSI